MDVVSNFVWYGADWRLNLVDDESILFRGIFFSVLYSCWVPFSLAGYFTKSNLSYIKKKLVERPD